MLIHWFPGHMATAHREIRERLSAVDLIIEVLDARIPRSSSNPLIAELRGSKPSIQILNKRDLADPEITEAWLSHLRAQPGLTAIAHQTGQRGFPAALTSLARGLVPPGRARPLTAMIIGIPNVGKSTLLNGLAGRAIAKAGAKPAVTQMQQRVAVGSSLVLYDTPGFLWHKLSPAQGLRLAVTGAISERVLEIEEIAAAAAQLLETRHPGALARAYGLQTLPEGDAARLEAIGQSRGYLLRGGVVDLKRAAERLLQDLRAGTLGPISLEAPGEEEEAQGGQGE